MLITNNQMANFDQDESYWEASRSISFTFDENEGDFVSIDKIEKEKEQQLRTTSPSRRSTVAPVSFNNVLSTVHIKQDSVKLFTTQTSIGSLSIGSGDTGDIENAVQRMVLGTPISLENFKGLSDKLCLLDEALKWHDGNSIFTVLCFLRATLKPRIFIQEILRRPDALNHYKKFLSVNQDSSVLSDLLTMLGANEEAAIFLYNNLMISQARAETKLQNLRKFHSNHIHSNPELTFIEKLVVEQTKLLEHQLAIEESDSRAEKERSNLIFLEFPRPNLPGQSLLSTLHYCCLYHYHQPENILTSPAHFRKFFVLNDKQFVWVALQALIKNKLWKDIEMLFQTKSWMKVTKMSCCIGFDKVAHLLHKAEAPVEEVTKYLLLLDSSHRLELAKKFKYNRFVIDTIVTLRDRQELQSFSRMLTQNSPDHLYAMESLRASSIKWKN